jgi:hypothetical protein
MFQKRAACDGETLRHRPRIKETCGFAGDSQISRRRNFFCTLRECAVNQRFFTGDFAPVSTAEFAGE